MIRKVRGFQDALTPVATPRGVKDKPVVSGPAPKARQASGTAKARLARVAKKAPEVMVKVSGRTGSAGHLKAHLEYISRNGEVTLAGREGELFFGRDQVHELADDWGGDVEQTPGRRKDSPYSVSIVLSMPSGTDPGALRDAAAAFAQERFSDTFDYVMAYHDDTRSPHVHLTVKTVGDRGERLNLRKGDLDAMRQSFAKALRRRGVEAEATPRRARGVTRKGDRLPIRKLKERGVASTREQEARREALDRVRSGDTGRRPWEAALHERRSATQSVYLDAAADLVKSRDPAERALALRIGQFVGSMPNGDTRQQAMMREAQLEVAGRETPKRDAEDKHR